VKQAKIPRAPKTTISEIWK